MEVPMTVIDSRTREAVLGKTRTTLQRLSGSVSLLLTVP